jgi:hypothetical protein
LLAKLEANVNGMSVLEMKSPSIVLADRPLPKIGPFDLSIHISATVVLSAEDARRKVNRYVHREVSYLLRAELPSLVIAEHVYWRVPIMLTLPSHGPVGAVGSMDVDVTTGDLMVNSGLIVEIQQRAHDLVARTSPHTAPAG